VSTNTFTSLSSTTRTLEPSSAAGAPFASSGAASAAAAVRAVISNENADPLPGSLATAIRPPCISTSLRQIARPSPLPPYFIPMS
jgi:hypothetical protein